MFTEKLAHESDQPSGRLAARAGDHRGIGDHLTALEGAHGSVGLLDLRVEQFCHQVIGRMGRSPFDVIGELRDRLLEGRRAEQAAAGFDGDAFVVALADLLLPLFGDAEQVADRPHGHDRAEIVDEVESVQVTKRIQCARTQVAHQPFDRQHAAGGENPRQQAAVQVVQRRVFPQQDAGRYLDAAEQDVGGGAVPRAVGLPIVQCGRDIVVATERVKVVLVVVVERGLGAHPLPYRIGVVVDGVVERVVIQLDC